MSEATWCPGCPNFLIKAAVQKTINKLISKGYKKEDFAIFTDIGCNSKIYDALEEYSAFYGLHGRAIPAAFGASVANPELKILCFGGDGGTYNEGISHFVHACRYNADMTLIVHDNQVFSLTTGQVTATTEEGFVEKTHPFGNKDKPINPILLALELGATFVARVSALDVDHMAEVLEGAIKHKGFSFIDILQPCLIYHNSTETLTKKTYKIKTPFLKSKAIELSRKWNYENSSKIPVGIFYQSKEPTFEEKYIKRK